ncbi:hypothetical protein CIK95_06885 [Prevotella sp. P5-108]|nr:hypothetical protein CIK95_06885 [Prevotella sp. P5-108]
MKAIPAAGHNKNHKVMIRTQKANCALLPALRITGLPPVPPAVCSMVVVMLMVAGLTNKKRRGDVFYPFFVLFIINNV